MTQNRNKLIQLFVSNLANVIVHKILEESTTESLRNHYNEESQISFEVARRYREKINPVNNKMPEADIGEIKKEVLRKVNNELKLRITKGYTGIDLSQVEIILDKMLKELKVKE